jgi:hypothetical protein
MQKQFFPLFTHFAADNFNKIISFLITKSKNQRLMFKIKNTVYTFLLNLQNKHLLLGYSAHFAAVNKTILSHFPFNAQ